MPAAPLPEPDDPGAAFLFPEEVISQLTDEERKHGKYTLARLPEQKRKSIVQLLIERRPHRDIERMLSVHNETIRAVADAHAVEIDAAWNHFGKKLRRINWHLADRLEKEVTSFPIQSIPLALKLIGEHAELIEGRATERIEEVHRVDIYEHWKKYLAGQENGLDGEKFPVIDGELVTDQTPAPNETNPGETLAPGKQSDESRQPTQGNGQPPYCLSYESAREPEPKDSEPRPPGGGSAGADGPPPIVTDNLSRKFSPNGE